MVTVAASPGGTRSLPLAWLRWRAVPVHAGLTATTVLAVAWTTLFGYLAVVRDLAGGSHAEDLGFTEQVLFNFLRGQWFHMSIYDGATWNTEIDLSHVARPDSLLAFHIEPMLLALVPVYAAGGAAALLIIQAAALAAGAVPVFRITRHLTRSSACAVAVAAAYLLSPLGQWAVLADFHTSTLAAPLLLFSLERLLVARAPLHALLAAGLALSAREDVGPAVALMGLWLLVRKDTRGTGMALVSLGVTATVLALAILRHYSGGLSPFEVRYEPSLADIPAALTRPAVVSYATTLLLSGGWLGVFAPLALLPALPSLALNTLSTSPWMAAGKAHYSGLVLPFVTLAAGLALGRLVARPRLQHTASVALVATSVVGYVLGGAGPLAANYAPAQLTPHALTAASFAAELPAYAAVSASASLVPRVSQRAHVYVFPAVLDADYVFLDLRASPAPTSAGDVYLRTHALLAHGWRIEREDDGLVLLRRDGEAPPVATTPPLPLRTSSGVLTPSPVVTAQAGPPETTAPTLLGAALVPSPDGALDVDGPRWILRTTWQIDRPLPPGTRPDFWVDLQSGQQLHLWDVADVWWNPPDRWPVGEAVDVDVPGIPVRSFKSWAASWTAE